LLRHSHGRTPSQPSHRPEEPEIAAQQDETVQALAETELEQLEAQGEEAEIETDPTDSSDEDYHPIA
jgi:hypothetical protein